jgi:hypothetical protein
MNELYECANDYIETFQLYGDLEADSTLTGDDDLKRLSWSYRMK